MLGQPSVHGRASRSDGFRTVRRRVGAALRAATRWCRAMSSGLVVECPSQLGDEHVGWFLRELSAHKDEPTLTIDFSSVQFALATAVLLTAIGIREVREYRKRNGLPSVRVRIDRSHEAISYLMHVGFFQCVGAHVGKGVGEAPGGGRYIPITILREDEIPGEGILQDRLDHYSRRLAAVITTGRPGVGRATMLSYCLREAIRNVFEHADAPECFIFAQRWQGGETEIVIADEGIGVLRSMSRAHSVARPHEALRLALKPGVSGAGEPKSDSRWANSGFGLYVLSELGSRLGTFAIASDGLMFRRRQPDGLEGMAMMPVRGTTVGLHVNTSTAGDFSALLGEIVAQGEREAERLPGATRKASGMSKTV